ncbi:stress responsive a/B barrel domain-containing protein [Purpureocillium lavendulum]|uniref:Stress responsive a/B barrel domain-containing protein n=1 Tax=Purpureocillium lavendulum TaxID=1247861 RepID=A0AB34G682_9HYPO|nr:stress responsive a/B barrel domain-containing protein [Purpureocillium lavendulum]
MSVKHIVQFQFKATATPEAINQCVSDMLGLRELCVHPTTQKQYIKSSVGGKDMSIEGLQHGITHAFIVEFDSVADRDYYVKEDPAHITFVKTYVTSPDSILEKGQVIDFVPGDF